MKPIVATILSLGAVGAGIFLLRRSGGSMHGGFRGAAEVRELELYCENDGDLHRQQGSYIEKNLAKRLAKGTYNHEKAKKAWGYLVESCAKKYAKEFSIGTDWHKIFSVADRREVARSMADSFRNEYAIQNR